MGKSRKFKNIEKRLIVTQRNDLIQKASTDTNQMRNLTRQSFVLDVYQRKMISLLISHVRPDAKEFELETISFSDFIKFMGIPKGGKTIDLIHESISNLMGMSFAVEIRPSVVRYYHWIAGGCEVDEDAKVIHIQLDPALKPFLLGNKKKFTQYEIGFISNFKRKYSCRLYEYLRSMVGIGCANFSVENFSAKITDGMYIRAADLKRYVIEPALEEINATSDITVSYEECRGPGPRGKLKTTSYKFHIKEKTFEEKQIIMGTWGIPFEDILEYDEKTRPKFCDDDYDYKIHGLPFQ